MTINAIVHQIVTDKMLQTMLAAVAIDLVFGVLAAVKLKTFNLAFLANFARNDVLGKLVPWSALEVGAIVAGGANIVIPGFDLTNIATASGAIIIAALAGSILSSLKDLGLSSVPPALGVRPLMPLLALGIGLVGLLILVIIIILIVRLI